MTSSCLAGNCYLPIIHSSAFHGCMHLINPHGTSQGTTALVVLYQVTDDRPAQAPQPKRKKLLAHRESTSSPAVSSNAPCHPPLPDTNTPGLLGPSGARHVTRFLCSWNVITGSTAAPAAGAMMRFRSYRLICNQKDTYTQVTCRLSTQ